MIYDKICAWCDVAFSCRHEQQMCCSKSCAIYFRNGPLDHRQDFEESYIPEPNSGCWLWIGLGVSDSGYGVMPRMRPTKLAHRASYEFFYGPIPSKLCVLHTCDNRLCVNPDHIYLGTRPQNIKDMVDRNRQPKGISKFNAKLDDEKVRLLRSMMGTNAAVARHFNVSPAVISKARRRVTWKHV